MKTLIYERKRENMIDFKPIKFSIYLAIVLMQFWLCEVSVARPVFPGAEGFGADTRAAYGNGTNPTIFVVTDTTNRNKTPGDSIRNGIPVKTGSFQEAIKYPIDNKVIIFEVSGTITANQRLTLDDNYVTIAGQTAPSPGITLRGATLQITGHDVLVQHLRVRVGDYSFTTGVPPNSRDSINTATFLDKTPSNVVVDHCSVSWALDENVGIVGRDITYSNCIFSEPLNEYESGHTSKNMIIGRAKNIAVIKNLFAHAVDRNPYLTYGNSSTVIANNLIYNAKHYTTILQMDKGTFQASIVGNVIKGGPDSNDRCHYNYPTLWSPSWNPWYMGGSGSMLYLEDTKTDGGWYAGVNAWDCVYNRHGLNTTLFKQTSPPIWPAGFSALPSSEVEAYVLTNAGARPSDRDTVDARIINDVINGTGQLPDCVQIDCSKTAGGWPNLAQNTRMLTFPNNPHGDDDRNGYTNLEELLHELAAQVENTSVKSSLQPPQNAKIIQ